MVWLKKNKFLALLVALFLAQFFFISPLGEFPLNDDWVHAEMAQHWAETGSFRLNPFTGPLLYTQLIYGAGLIKVFGFSFTLLRFSTLAITASLVFGIWYFLKNQTKNEPLAFLGALLIWLNPLVYTLSFTFMSDIPALAFLFLGIISFLQGSNKNKVIWFWFGAISTVAGFFIRQTVILLLPAAGLLTLLKPSLRKIKYFIAIIIPGLVAVVIYYWLQNNQLLGEGTGFHDIKSKKELIKHALWWTVYTSLYLGLFLLPLTVNFIKKINLKLHLFFGLFGLAFTTFLYFYKQKLFPYVPNTITPEGLGPMTDTLSGLYLPLFPHWVWLLVSGLAGLGLGFLLANLWLILKNNKFYTSPHIIIINFSLIFCGPILLFTGFDRYFIPLILTGTLLLILENPHTKPSPLAWLIILVMSFYTLSQTQFYLNWNRAKAELVTVAITKYGAEINTLDAGYEWTGYYGYWQSAQIPKVYRWPVGSPWWIRFLMINNNRQQVISSSPEKNYSIIEQRSVRGLNPNNKLYLLQRNDGQK